MKAERGGGGEGLPARARVQCDAAAGHVTGRARVSLISRLMHAARHANQSRNSIAALAAFGLRSRLRLPAAAGFGASAAAGRGEEEEAARGEEEACEATCGNGCGN